MDDPKPRDALPRNADGSVDYAAMVERLLEFAGPPAPRSRGRPRKSKWEEFEDHIKILEDAAKAQAAWNIIRERKGLPQQRLTGKQIAGILKKFAKAGGVSKYPGASERRIEN